MTNYFKNPDALVDTVRAILSGESVKVEEDIERKSDVKMIKTRMPDGKLVMKKSRPAIDIGKGKTESIIGETNKNDDSDDGEGLDAVQPKAVKKKFKDRKDKDIDNDGDADSSDEYLHARRKAISKSVKEEENPANSQHLCAKNVVHESWGEGSCVATMHADPDEEGNIEWYDVMFDHGIEEQVSIEELKVTKAESHMHSSKKKIKESKVKENEDDDDEDDDQDDMPKAKTKKDVDKDTSKEDEENGKKNKVGGKKDTIDVDPSIDDQKMTSEMTDSQTKKREEIVLSMKDKMPDFKKKYGDRAKDVMYATATKMAMKEGFELDEISKKTLSSYASKASDARGHRDLPTKKVDNRYAGVSKASKRLKEEDELDEIAVGKPLKGTIGKVKKLYKEKPKKEEVEVDEGQKPYVSMDRDGAHVLDSSGKTVKSFAMKDKQKAMDYLKKNYNKLIEEDVDLDEGRGRPRKDGTATADTDREQIQMQLRKSISLRGLKDVVFDDGKKVKVSARDARDVLGKLDAIKAPKERQNAIVHIAKSHKNLTDFASGKSGEMDPEQRRQDAMNNPFKKK